MEVRLIVGASRAPQALSSRLMNRFGTTEEQAAAILFLTSDEAP
jgi:NAD(P)-dependent dehydrogenase (short-subunit alcohol dehydrogenase family)